MVRLRRPDDRRAGMRGLRGAARLPAGDRPHRRACAAADAGAGRRAGRHAVLQSWRAGRHGQHPVPAMVWRVPRGGASILRHRELGSARRRGVDPAALLRQPGRGGRAHRRSRRLPGDLRRAAHLARRLCEVRASLCDPGSGSPRASLHRRHRARPRAASPRERRGAAHLLGRVLRHLSRRDLCRALSGEYPGTRPRWQPFAAGLDGGRRSRSAVAARRPHRLLPGGSSVRPLPPALRRRRAGALRLRSDELRPHTAGSGTTSSTG